MQTRSLAFRRASCRSWTIPLWPGRIGIYSRAVQTWNSSYFEEAWHDLVDVLDVVQVLSKRVVDVDRHHLDGVCIEIDIDVHLKLHLPVGLTLIDHRKHSKDLDLEDGASEEKIKWWLIVGNITEYGRSIDYWHSLANKALQVPWMDRRSNLTNIDWIVVALAVGRRVRVVGVFPCLSIKKC